MIWLTWRQFRLPALLGVAALALLGAYLVHLGLDIRHSYDVYQARGTLSQLQDDYLGTMLLLAAAFGLIPALIGAFWGAPLIARELETGTHRLVWNQSVTRRRWLVVKLAAVGLASVAFAGLASAALTWAAGPYDRVADDRFSTIVFGARDIAPLGYAAFACVLGAVAGLLLRRTVAAMALTMLAVVVVQFAVPNLLRPHFMPPERSTLAMTADAVNQAHSLGSITGGAVVGGLSIPGTWITEVSELRTADGRAIGDEAFGACFDHAPKTGAGGRFGDIAVCLGKLGLHVDVAYQPNNRYWAFQLIETAFYLALAGLLAALGLWRIGRRPS